MDPTQPIMKERAAKWLLEAEQLAELPKLAGPLKIPDTIRIVSLRHVRPTLDYPPHQTGVQMNWQRKVSPDLFP